MNPRPSEEPATLPRAVVEVPEEERVSLRDLGLVPGAPATAVRPAGHVLRREEATRAHGFARAAALLSIVGLATPWLLPGATWLKSTMVGALIVLAAASLAVWRVASDPLRYTRVLARTYGAVCACATLTIIYALGVFSPAPMLVMLGVAFFALGDDKLLALGLPAAMALAYALLALLVSLGVLPDAGATRATDLPMSVRVAIAAFVPLFFLVGLWQARVGRRAMLEALARSNEAVRAKMQFDAQIEEANRDIDHLLRIGVKRAGPYSGVTCGKYQLGDLIGRGAMGEVYAAKQVDSGQTAAVKLLQPNMVGDTHLVARFLREGEAASKLRGPNVVEILEVGRTDSGAPFLVMELLRGHDLAWHLQHRIRLSLDEILGIVDQVATGLEAARLAGIVHRDLKPQNLFLAQQPAAAPLWKILDFGVSRLMGSGGTLTQEGIVGTPGYMSPEQAGGREATHRSDVFSFGVVVYRALTGEAPFAGPDTPQILYQVVYRCPTRPGEIVPGLPPDVDLALAIALAKDPEDRFASALELAHALRAAAKNQLDPAHRLHAQTLLAALPWGRSLREGSTVG